MDISKLQNGTSTDRVADKRVQDSGTASKAGKVHKADDAGKAEATERAASNSTDKVRWSADAQSIREGVTAAKAAPDMRADKVATLKAQIKNGTYKPDSKAVAEKMIRSSLEDDILTRME